MQASDQAITYGRHIRALAILGIPIIVGQLGTIIQGLADTIMVGHFSAHSLAAAGFVNNIMVLVLIFALGYSYAITPVIGPMHARGEFENAGKALKAGLQVNGALGMVLFLLMGTLYFFLGHMGQPEELLPEIRPYYIVVVLSIPIQSLFNAFKQFFDSIGNTRTPMWIMISANLFNIVGNYLLIYGIGPFPQLGLLGAGISTTLSRILMLVVIYGIFISNEKYKKYHSGFQAKGETTDMRRMLHKLGRPLGLQMGMETASFSLCAVMQGWIGADPLAAHQIMTSVGSTCFMVYRGSRSHTSQPFPRSKRHQERAPQFPHRLPDDSGYRTDIGHYHQYFHYRHLRFLHRRHEHTAYRRQSGHPVRIISIRRRPANQFRQFTTRHCRRTPAHALRVPVLHCHFSAAELSAGLHIPWRTGRNMDGFPCGIDVGRGTLLPPFPP